MLGPIAFRPSTCEIAVDAATSRLEPRVMQVLALLARRRGRVVSRFELIEQCWGGRAVGDDAINRCIQALRKLAALHGGFTILTVPRVGYRLDAAQAEPSPVNTAESVRLSERRQLTLLSCELVRTGSSAPDPEAWYAAARPWHDMAMAIAAQAGAHVDSDPGDRLTAWFGHPRAQEGAAENAVQAALQITERTLGLGAAFALSARAGVHAGLMLVTEPALGRTELFGEVRTIAAQARSHAAAGTVAVTQAVADRLPTAFDLEPLARVSMEEPLFLVREAGAARARRRVEARFVGREAELAQVGARWRQVCAGSGQFVLVEGEAGIGKSRLVREFAGKIVQPHRVIACQGAEQFAEQPFHAARQIVRSALGMQSRARSEVATQELSAALDAAASLGVEARQLVGDMLGVPVPDGATRPLLPPERRRQLLLEALAGWMLDLANEEPVLLVVDDVQWIDASTVELLELLARQCVGRRLLILGTTRSPSRIDWPLRAHHLGLTLRELGEAEMRELVGSLAGERPIPEETINAAIARADGVPLFGEALGKLLTGDTTEAQIPVTLLDTLAARLDRLGDARGVAYAAAVIGREFADDLLRSLLAGPGDGLGDQIDSLVNAGLVAASGEAGEGHFRFRHALIRDAAYGALPSEQRRGLHGQVAKVLEA